ncbi:MAG: hypothetical protein HUJ78_06405 [Mogibacterium sp.]|nr:hypothetical protein [Mogibacterium sp.]
MGFTKEQELYDKNQCIGLLVVNYPEPSEWDVDGFYEMADAEIAGIVSDESVYDRKAVFGETNYYKYYKKFKKTYPVILQYESFAFKGRPFPRNNPVVEAPFLAEVVTKVLSGCHDIDKTSGDVVFYSPTEKEDFMGLRGEVIHTYPNDVAARDDDGIIKSLIAGADDRTAGSDESRNVFYPFFGTPGQDTSELESAAKVLEKYVKTLAPAAKCEYILL